MTISEQSLKQDIAAVNSITAIPTILDIVCRSTGMRFAAVARVAEDRWVACSVRDDLAFGLVPGGELKVETTICHEIRHSGKAVIIDNVSQDPCYRDHHTPAIYGLQSYISMPIRLSDGSFFGTLCAIDPEPHVLNTPEIIKMFEMFADVIGFHLSAINRVEQSEADLRGEQETAALREQFIAVLSHDLRNPLAAIDGGMRLLRKMPLNERAIKILTLIQNSTSRMQALIDDVMDFARGRLGSGLQIERKPDTQIESVLLQVIDELLMSAPGRTIESSILVAPKIHCDPKRIGQLASNLLGNAISYGAPDKPITLKAVTSQDEFELSVTNCGEPIPPAIMEKIFQPFTRGEVRPSLQGLGLGLYIAKSIADAHEGSITVESNEEATRFTFRMPLSARGFIDTAPLVPA
jgi:signal transduction histidine kinase